MMKNAIVAQSGGPTTAINASLAGVIKGCLESHEIDVLYGALNGVEGLMDERLVNLTDIFDHNEENLNVLKMTPAMYLGSCRRKLKDVDQDSSEYDIIINIFRKYHIHYFFYIGGNDSMDTVGKMSRYVKEHQMDVKVIGIPKTIDNDLVVTDHTPGFGSAARYVAASVLEMAHDTYIYNTKCSHCGDYGKRCRMADGSQCAGKKQLQPGTASDLPAGASFFKGTVYRRYQSAV